MRLRSILSVMAVVGLSQALATEKIGVECSPSGRFDTRQLSSGFPNGGVGHDGGTYATNEVWSAKDRHVVYGTVLVETNTTLTIEAGADVRFVGGGILARGTCKAEGVHFADAGEIDVPSYVLKGNVVTDTSTTFRCITYQDGLPQSDASVVCRFNTRNLGTEDFGDAVVHDGGLVANDETWTAGSVHVVYGTLVVPDGVSLKIERGAVVRFVGGGIVSIGELIAQGVRFEDAGAFPIPTYTVAGNVVTDADTVFAGASALDKSYAFATSPSTPFDTRNLVGAGFGNATVHNGGLLTNDETWPAGSVHVVYGTLLVQTNVTLKIERGATVKFVGGGIRAKGELIAEGVTFADAGTMAVPSYSLAGNVMVDADTVVEGSYAEDAALAMASSDFAYFNNATNDLRYAHQNERITFSTEWDDASEVSVSVLGPSGATVVLTNGAAVCDGVLNWNATDGEGEYTFKHATDRGEMSAVLTVVDGVCFHNGPVLSDEVWKNDVVHVVDGTVTVRKNAKLTIEPGAVVKFMGGTSLTLNNGSCDAIGVTFTHINDDAVGGDTLGDGDATEPIRGGYSVDSNVVVDRSTTLRYLAAAQQTVVIENLRAKQRYPWNGIVDIDFSVYCNDPTAVNNVMLSASDRENLKSLRVRTYECTTSQNATSWYLGIGLAIGLAIGDHHVEWNSTADNPVCVSSNVLLYVRRAIGLSVHHASVSLPIDTRVGMRVARSKELISYDPKWVSGESLTIECNGEALVEAAEPGQYEWDSTGLEPGLYEFLAKSGAPSPEADGGGTPSLPAIEGGVLSASFAVLGNDTEVHAGRVLGEKHVEHVVTPTNEFDYVWYDSAVTWKADTVHVIERDVIVPTGTTLTIEPGAVVKFVPGVGLSLEKNAYCIAIGAVFTHINDDTVGGDTLFDGDEAKLVQDDYYVDSNITDDETTEYRYLSPKAVTLSGTMSQNETWKGYKVYHVTGDLTISRGVTLTIEPGAVVKFDAGKSLTVAAGGTLSALGTRAQPIVFTSVKDDEYGGDTNGDGDATRAQAGDWSKIATSGGTANMSHVQILYASKYETTGAINMNGGSVSFDYGLIAHGQYDAIGVESGSFSMKNSIVSDCLIVCRHWPKVPIVNCVFYNCGRITQGGSQTFVNCIFAEMSEAWEAFGFPRSTYRNCCFFNRSGSVLTKEGYQDALLVCGSSGNIWADPLFVDAANGDFRLQDGSPCIDAGNGSYAPATDYFGQTRQTVDAATAKGSKAANGNYPDIGIHEVMPGVVPTDVDLTVISVTAPAEMTVGEKVVVSWTVKNVGAAYATGSWRDKAEIVCANGTAVALGEKTVTATLAPGAEQTFTATWTVPSAQAGTVHVRVTANAERDIFEGTLVANNVLTAETATELALPTCAIPSDGHAGRVTVPAGDCVSYKLGADFAAGGLLVVTSAKPVVVRTGNGQLPTADTYHGTAVQIADGQWLVSVPEGGEAYVSIENEGAATADVDVSYQEGAFALYDTGAPVAYTTGHGNDLVVTVYGNGFVGGGERGAPALPGTMAVALVGAGAVIEAAEITVSAGGTKAVVTFAEADCLSGSYHLRLSKDGQTLVQAGNPITIQNRATGGLPIPGKMEYSLELSETVRQGREYMGYIVYGNSGRGMATAPYLRVTASNGSYVRFSQSDAWSSQLELMGVSQTYPASKVKAGEAIKVPFYYMTSTTSADIRLGVASSADGDFPWETNGRYMRPSWASDEFWGLAFAILKANVGTTWGDWISRMRHNADYLMKLGKPTCRLEPLWQLEVNEALGVDHAVSTLAGGTDLARSGRGLGLALRRSYGAAFYSRFKSGVFGYGWSDNYSAWAELQDSGSTLALHSGGGSTYRFYKTNGIWAPEDARDKTRVSETASEYVLTYRSGTVQRIAKSNMRVKSITDNQGNAISFTYADVSGGVPAAGGRGVIARTLTRVAHTDGQTLDFAYEGGKLVSVTDDQGRVVRYAYDGDMLASVTAFNGLVTRYAYYPADGTPTSRALRQIVYPDGNTKDFTYDAAGRVATAAVNGNQMLTEIVRGEFGSYKTIAPNGGISSVSIGVSGEVLETVNALGQKVTRTYTDDTLLESLVGPTGKRSKIAYDADGNAVKATDAAGAQTSFAYTSDYGALAKVTDARGNSFNYGYDRLGRSEQISYADNSLERIQYSDRGDITNSVNRRGQSVAYTYDREGNVLSETWETGRTLTWQYDDRGNCTNACDSETGAVTMEYDANERLTRIAYPNGHGFTYAYDAFGRTTARTSFDGFAQKYEYDALGRLKKLTDGDGKAYLENVYDETTGQLWLMKYGNGTIVSNAYDILGRTTGIYHYTFDDGDGVSGTSGLVGGDHRAPRLSAFFEYAYDAEGRRISQTTAEGVERYTYDTVGQLTDVTYPDGTEEHFRYDAVGNRLTANGDTYEVNNLNQYTLVGSAPRADRTSYTYDADGNMTSKTHPTDGTTTYTYDLQNRLVAVTNETKDIRWACVYDVFGNRVKVIDHDAVTEKVFVQGSLPSVAEEWQGANMKKRKIGMGATSFAAIESGSVLYSHEDGRMSTCVVSDADGKVKSSGSVKAFGEKRAGDAHNFVDMLGVEYDDATGLHFMRNRYYDAVLGRFICVDLVGMSAGDINWYRYCRSDPVNFTDPTGLNAVVNESVRVGCKTVVTNPIVKRQIRKFVAKKVATYGARVAARHVAANVLQVNPYVEAGLIVWDIADGLYTAYKVYEIWRTVEGSGQVTSTGGGGEGGPPKSHDGDGDGDDPCKALKDEYESGRLTGEEKLRYELMCIPDGPNLDVNG